MAASGAPGTKELAATALKTRDGDGPTKVAVGKDTVLRMLSQERQTTSRVWMSSLAAVLVVLAVGGVGLYWHNAAVAKRLQDEAAAERSRAARECFDERFAAVGPNGQRHP